jgi:hypothetical protein
MVVFVSNTYRCLNETRERDQKDEDLTDDDLIYHRMGYTFYLSN